ncbi:hypothetical protein FWG95_03000 [Candidatus Saccharibacteria bacterium]|nr:hypothetical protein [Candidatus Saccharibacteria bacterium]
MARQKVDTNFSRGVHGRTTHFRPGSITDTSEFAFGRDRILMPPDVMVPEIPEPIISRGRTAVKLTIVQPPSGIQLGGGAAIHFPRWGQTGQQIPPYDLYHSTALRPDMTHIFVHPLGFGEAGVLGKGKVKQVAKSGSFLPYGEVFADALRPVVKDFDHVSAEGGSLGGLYALATIGHDLEVPASVFMSDSPGDHYMKPFQWAVAFNALEGRHSRGYNQLDPQKSDLSWLERAILFSRQLKSDPTNRPTTKERLWHQGDAARKIVLASDLPAAAEYATSIDVATMEASSLTNPQYLAPIIGHVARRYSDTDFRMHEVYDQAHGATKYLSAALPALLAERDSLV